MATTKLWTVEDIARLPDDAFRYALIRGGALPHAATDVSAWTSRHGGGAHLYHFVEEHGLGVISDQSGFIFERDPDTLLGPDLAFVQRARIPADENTYPAVAPDLVVEVASPPQTGPSIEEKTAIYPAAGVRLIWIVYPARRTVRVYRADGTERLLTENDVIDGEGVLPEFRLPVSRLFA